MVAASNCSFANARADCVATCGKWAGWQQTGKYALVALGVIAAIGLAVAVAMKFGAFNASFGATALSSIPNFPTYLLIASAVTLGALFVGRGIKCFN